jgi:transmembrane sensor
VNEPDHKPATPDDAVEAAAAAWLVQKDEGFTAEQQAEFEQWRNAKPEHAVAVAMLEETCGILKGMPALRSERRVEPLEPALAGARTKVFRLPFASKVMLALAACVAIALTAFWALRVSGETFVQTYATAAGEVRRIVLPDESSVALNGSTSVRVEFSRSVRRVLIERGEAHFTVTGNPARPFLVGVANVGVRAVGTAFNVKLARKSVDVIVTEGRVQVSRIGAMATKSISADERWSTEAPMLIAGQRVVISTESGSSGALQVMSVNPAAQRRALSWQAPRLVFVDTPLSEVVERFNEYNAVQLSIADPELASRAVGGTFRADQVETFARLLEQSRDMTVERSDADRIVLRRVTR